MDASHFRKVQVPQYRCACLKVLAAQVLQVAAITPNIMSLLSGKETLSLTKRYLLAPSPGVRDVYMGIGGLLLVLAVIAFAGATFSFDLERKALLRPVGVGLGVLGALFWGRASIVPSAERQR
ncbi:MAG: hypothetical protein ACSHXK_00085 [Oceanococcus sp.]